MTSMTIPEPRRIPVGAFHVTTLHDGIIPGGEGALRNIPRDTIEKTLQQAGCFPRPVDVNSFLVETGDRRVLFDTGAGPYMGSRAGGLQAQIAALGLTPKDIDVVVVTHVHPDHIGGLTDRDSGARLFPNAELYVHQAELDHWLDDGARARAREADRAIYFDLPCGQMEPYRAQLVPFTEGEFLPGITAISATGHTPGHSVFLVGTGDDHLMIWSDTVHIPEVQIPYPEAGVIFDLDPQAAIDSRRKVFEMAVTEAFPLVGMHVGQDGFGRLQRDGDGYRLEPMCSVPTSGGSDLR